MTIHFSRLANDLLATWRKESHVATLLEKLSAITDVDTADVIIREAAEEMHTFAQANRGHKDWGTYCTIMGVMRNLNVRIWSNSI